MNFVFISPNFPESYYLFCQGLKENNMNVLGVGDAPYDELKEELRNSLTEYYKVKSLENYDEVFKAVAYFSFKYGKIDWLESNNEYWLMQDAKLRTDFNITTGLKEGPDQIDVIKYKSKMKACYEAAGVPTARYHLCTDYAAGKAFIDEVGYPVVVKPDNGVGASATYKLSNDEELANFYNNLPTNQYIMEEYVDGYIVSYDGVANSNRDIVFETSHVFPTPIMDIVNEVRDVEYYSVREIPADLKDAGRRVIKSFPTNSRFFHCEFFRLRSAKKGLGEVGDIVGLEVNMRPPGGYTPDMMNYANQINVFKIWADMIAYDSSIYNHDRPYCCVYAARRDCINYAQSLEEARAQFEGKIVMRFRNPAAIAGAMGDEVTCAIVESEDEAKNFIDVMLKKA